MKHTISCAARAAAVALLAGVVAYPQAAMAARKHCPSSTGACKVQLILVDGKPSVPDDPIVLAKGRHNIHINWRAPSGWEFLDGGVSLKSSASGGQFDQWCATDSDNSRCATRNPKGRQYHCRAFNQTPGSHAYRLRLHKIGTNIEHEIDPTIINQG
jgi:hypothetical protein